MDDKSSVENGRLFYLNDDGKLDLFYIQKKRFLYRKRNNSAILMECT